jgi:hypothetical protein
MLNLANILPIAYCSSIEVLQLTDRLCRDMPDGTYAEAGVAAGAHGIIMSRYGKTYLFDSYQGIPLHTKEDKEWTDHYGEPGNDPRMSSGITSIPLHEVKKNIVRYGGKIDNCEFIHGWFIDTLPDFNEPLSVLRLDCDLYESYRQCLKYLLPLVIKGGYVIIDDITLSGCRQALAEAKIEINKVNLIAVSKEGAVGWFKV